MARAAAAVHHAPPARRVRLLLAGEGGRLRGLVSTDGGLPAHDGGRGGWPHLSLPPPRRSEKRGPSLPGEDGRPPRGQEGQDLPADGGRALHRDAPGGARPETRLERQVVVGRDRLLLLRRDLGGEADYVEEAAARGGRQRVDVILRGSIDARRAFVRGAHRRDAARAPVGGTTDPRGRASQLGLQADHAAAAVRRRRGDPGLRRLCEGGDGT